MQKQVLFLILSAVCTTLCIDLIYHVKETNNPITYLGDVATDIQSEKGILSNRHKLIWFSQLQQGGNANFHLFNVTQTGKLYAIQPLDAEILCEYDKECSRIIVVAVRFQQSFIKILEIKVIISDVNDHKPEFLKDQILLRFSEGDGKGITKHIPNAVDKDVGALNSQINYKLLKHEGDPFELTVSENVDSTSTLGIRLNERIDREKNDSYKIQIIAEDSGFPSQKSQLEILITVEDINDNAPSFVQNVYNITVIYKHQWSKPIATLSAIDQDSGDNGKISYHFSTKTSMINRSFFQLNEKTGQLFFTENFNSKLNQSCKLFIKATDQGNPPLSSIALMLVNIINQQNKAPKIDINFISKEKEEKVYISEAIEIGSFIAFVKITDDDAGKNGEVYCKLRAKKFELESLGSNKYKVILKEEIDRELEVSVNFTISCRDHGTPPLETNKSVIIELEDINDMRPEFSKDEFKFSVHENQKPNFPIGLVSANDLDLGPGGQLSYFLLSKKGERLPFEISDFGFISTTDALDREEQEEYHFQILVKDKGIPVLNNTVNTTVTVLDQNDNSPYFIFPRHSNFIMDVYFYSWGSRNITVLRAVDDDININAFLQYEISAGNQKNLFQLDKYSGVLSFTRQLFQKDTGLYHLEIIAKDSGSPILATSTNLSLKVTVSNATSSFSSMFLQQEPHSVRIYLVLIVIFVALALSVSIVVITALCVVRTNKQRNLLCYQRKNASSQSLKGVKQQEHLYQPAANDSYSQDFNSKQESCKQHELAYSWKGSTPRIHSDMQTERKHQNFLDDMVIIYDGPRIQSSFKPEFLGNYNEMSEVSSCNYTGHGWTEADANHYEELLDIYAFPIKHQNRKTSCKSLSKSIEDQNFMYRETSDNMAYGSSSNLSSKPKPGSMFCTKPLPEIPQKMFPSTSLNV
ncbi:putative protocadherin beta-18 [Octopus sinensis]|uniref:Protocadherin beta-18 n=1 Tax=Octopus sinensis TaxID=2607531 RepID=A0A7E6F9S4_9MOLL|nr:putative protocadherin beta-18 [Octopus sinensis]XP_036364499.1 putative protocadherin beta-18 [Octopus sinensis]